MVKKYLFVCRYNFTRSKYFAKFFRNYLVERGLLGKVDSAGIGFSSIFLGKKVNQSILDKTDVVFVMEKYMKNFISRRFDFPENKIFVLNVEDIYGIFKKKSLEDLNNSFKSINWNKYL